MKILATARKAVAAAFGENRVAKRDGVFVSRPVLNGQEWHDWAVKYGVPNPQAADDFHVTIVYSLVDVKMIPDPTIKSIYIGPGYGDAACFGFLGPKLDNLCVLFGDWDLWNRHYNFVSNGAVTTFPTYRPHMTVSQDAPSFELSDEALANAPIYINLGPEEFADLKGAGADDDAEDPADDSDDPDDMSVIVVVEVACAAAKKALDASLAGQGPDLSFLERYDLAEIASHLPVTKAIAKRMAAADWAPAELKSLGAVAKTHGSLRSVDVEIQMGAAVPASVLKSTKVTNAVLKMDDDRRLVWSIANVSTVKGEKYYDTDDDHFSVRALEEFAIDLMKNSRESTFDHVGASQNTIVQAMVFSDDLQKALGFDIGMECLVTCTEIHPDRWDEVKKGGWSQSIAGTFFYLEDGESG